MTFRHSATHSRGPLRRSKRGQSLVEAAILLPLVLFLSLGVIDLGRAFYYREAASNSARQALRMAVSGYQHSTANNICGSTSGGPVAVTVTSAVPPSGGSIVAIANQAAVESSSDGTPAGSAVRGSTLTATFHCLNGTAITNATGNGGPPTDPGSDAITISISVPMSLITPLLAPVIGTSYQLRVSSSQRTEY